MRTCLAVTCHDPAGTFADGIAAASPTIKATFDAIAVNATAETAQDTLNAVRSCCVEVITSLHAAGSVGIGTARRDALAQALTLEPEHVIYSDLDHVTRWALKAPLELRASCVEDPSHDLIVIGRSEGAWRREPERLRATEGLVNRIASDLFEVTGIWDFMMAVRVMNQRTARILAEECAEESVANDVIWPALARSKGLSLGYRAVDDLAYRFRDDFGAECDQRDGDVSEWISRLAIANQHVQALKSFLRAP